MWTTDCKRSTYTHHMHSSPTMAPTGKAGPAGKVGPMDMILCNYVAKYAVAQSQWLTLINTGY